MKQTISVYEGTECLGTVDVDSDPENMVMNLINCTINSDGRNVDVLHVADMKYGIVITEKSANRIYEICGVNEEYIK